MNSQELRALQEAYSQVYELEEGDNYDKNRKRAAQRAAARNEARAKGQTGNVPGVGYVTPRKERETYTDAAGTERHKTGARMPQKEDVDLYDIVLSHLLDEGYAESEQAAEAIMVNMSEDWRESICEGAYDVYLNRMGVKSKLSDMATDMLKSPEEKEKEEKERKKRNKTHSVGGDLMQKYRDAMNKNN